MLASDAAHVKGTDLTLQLFRRLFSEGLKVQRERMREARKVTREARQAQSLQQLAQVQALENFYKDQFAMLSENMAERSKNAQIRDNAQATVSKSADSVAPPLGLTTLPVNVWVGNSSLPEFSSAARKWLISSTSPCTILGLMTPEDVH